MDLHTAGHRRGVVAAPHRAAVEAGRAVLAEGGNAIEAMVAMAAATAAVYPHMCHLGGDAFWLIREPSGRVRAIMGAGRAGANASPAFYREHGHDMIPARGPLAALTAPGAVATWVMALEAARARGGRLPLRVLLEAAIRHARDGSAVSRSQAQLTAEKLAELAPVPGFAATFLADGKPPAAGTVRPQGALAATLEHLTTAGLDDFYRGDVARELVAPRHLDDFLQTGVLGQWGGAYREDSYLVQSRCKSSCGVFRALIGKRPFTSPWSRSTAISATATRAHGPLGARSG